MINFNSTPSFIQNIFKGSDLFNAGRFLSGIEANILLPTTIKDLERYQTFLELQDKRQLLQVDVMINGHVRSYQSMIVGIDFEQRQLVLDTFSPQLNPRFVGVNHSVTVRHVDNDQILEFSSKLVSISADADPLYFIELPEDAAYRQRRFYPRLGIKNRDHFSIKLHSPKRLPWFAQLKNISAGGACVDVGGDISKELTRNCQLSRCEIQLPFGIKIPCSVTVKNFRQQRRPYEHTQMNVSFHEMEFQNRLELQHQISLSQKLMADPNIKTEIPNQRDSLEVN